MRGRDIKRYGYNWAGLYLLWIPWHFPLHLDESITGASAKAESEFNKQFPAVYKHLCVYKEVLSKRNQSETGIRYEWYALQRWGANYWDDFAKPKIVWADLARTGNAFIYDETGFTSPNTTYLIASNDTAMLKFLIGLLNSKVILQYLDWIIVDRILAAKEKDSNADTSALESEIDALVYRLYGLTDEEIAVVEGRG